MKSHCWKIFAGTVLTCLAMARSGSSQSVADVELRTMISEVSSSRIEQTVRKLVSFGTRSTLSSQTDPNRGIGAARDWLFSEFQKISQESGGRLKVDKQAFTQSVGNRIPRPTILTNIIATLPGDTVGPEDRVFVVSGHYDSMPTSPTDPERDAPGANDDASGTAAVLEMARVMSKYHFKAPIIFMTVPGEEQGLLGAHYAAEQMKKAGWRVQAMFTNDIIGNTLGGNGIRDRKTVRVFSEGVPTTETTAEAATRRLVGGENDGPSRQLARTIKEVAQRYVPSLKVNLVYRRDRYNRGGDHIAFVERGFPAVRFTEPNENYQHQHQNVREEGGVKYGDLPEFVDFAYVAQVARVNLAALATMAGAPAPPRDLVMISTGLAYDTTLRWTADADSDVQYEIVWRSTDESDWSHRVMAKDRDKHTFKGMSKDNYFFGVRSADKSGRKSVVVFPRPGR